MKAKRSSCFLAAAVLLTCAGIARAETIFSYDFENLTPGDLVGQDGGRWVEGYSGYYHAYVGAGDGENTTLVGMGNPSKVRNGTGRAASSAYYNFDSPLLFTTADVNVEFSFYARVDKGGTNQTGRANLSFLWQGLSDTQRGSIGIDAYNWASTKPQAWFYSGNGTISFGNTLEPNHWYEVKAVVDFSRLCADGSTYGKITYQYRDATEHATTFTTDSVIHDMDMNLPLNGSGKIQANGMHLWIFSYGNADDAYAQHQFIDDVSIKRIPEPSALALSAAGLIGLLAYAWRKRK